MKKKYICIWIIDIIMDHRWSNLFFDAKISFTVRNQFVRVSRTI